MTDVSNTGLHELETLIGWGIVFCFCAALLWRTFRGDQ